jgi:hypothetical protein
MCVEWPATIGCVFGCRLSKKLEDLIREEHEEIQRLFDEGEARAMSLQEFSREILLRNEKVYTAVIAEIQDMREQVQANTKAVLSVLDRLEGSGGVA